MHDYAPPWLNFRVDFLPNEEGKTHTTSGTRRVHANENSRGYRADLVEIFLYVDACIARRDHCRAK